MNKTLILLSLLFLSVTNSYSQNFNWITPNKTYLKLYVIEDGIFRINKSDFTNNGINASGIDPRTVKVLNKGIQIPVFFQGENDGTFDDADYLDFYGQRNYGGPTKHYNGYSNSVAYVTDEKYDNYSDTNVYWLDWGGGTGSRMVISNFVSSVNYPDEFSMQPVHFEEDHIYYLGETTNSNTDFRYFSNEKVAGESWFWKIMTTNETHSSSFTPVNVNGSQTCELNLLLFPVSYNIQASNEHVVEVRVNSNLIGTMYADSLRRMDTVLYFPASLLNSGVNNDISLTYTPVTGNFFQPRIHLDFFELKYPRVMSFTNNFANIKLNGSDTTSKKINVTGALSSNPLSIYDIKNGIKIENHTINQNTLTFTGKGNSEFELANNNITKKPFRIENRLVNDLVSSSNGADYLIIYHKLFESAAQQLKGHRESFNNFRVKNADIKDIYDIFNYGIEDPVALRNFVSYAYNNWSGEKVQFVNLFGRASLDPKKNSSASVYYQNFIPTYGNPPTDGYFVNFNFGTFTYYHQISIGRLPVYTTVEAQDMVNKIITYDLQPPLKWWKNYLSITGGGNRQEQLNFQAKSENFISNYFAPAPASMNIARIYRNDSSGYVTYNYKDSIKKEFDRGQMIVNFIGHAAAQDWEIGLEDPATMENGDKQPLILSFTCFTGQNSETNKRSFGEKFILLPNKCAIGFVGTTGWSFSGIGDAYNDRLIKRFTKDSVRYTGELMSYASQQIAQDSNSFSARNTINCYNLLGDPATQLLMSPTPEFDIKPNDYTLSNSFPALGENIKLNIFPKNLGTFADSVRIRFNIKKDGALSQSRDTVFKFFGYIDTISHFFKIDTIGNYTMSVIMDPNKFYLQKFYDNDSISFPLTLRNISYTQIKPLNNAVVTSSNFKFTGLNPNVDYRTNDIKLIFQIDTIESFNSPVLQTYNNSNISSVSTSFNVNLPVTNINTLYYLRTNAIIDNDSSGWSDNTNIVYNPNVSANLDGVNDSTYTVYKSDPRQFGESSVSNLVYKDGGYKLDEFKGNLFIRSWGSNGFESSFFTINDFNYYSDGGFNRGLNLAKVKKLTGIPSEIKNFVFTSPASSDSVLNFLNTFDSTDYLLGYNASYVAGSDSLRSDAIAKFREFGSKGIDSISIGFFDTWAFFGYLGADTNNVCEHFHVFFSNTSWEPQECQVNPFFIEPEGYVVQEFGTADKWKDYSWEQTVLPTNSIDLDIYGIGTDNNNPVTLATGITSNLSVVLDTIDALQYSKLRLVNNLKIDTLTGLESPVFKSAKIKYVPPAEITPDNYSFTGSDTVVQEGDSVEFSVNYYSIGFRDIQNYINYWYVSVQGKNIYLRIDTINTPLRIDSMGTSSVKFSTAGLRDFKSDSDTLDLYFESEVLGDYNELFTYNNKAITQFIIQGDSLNPIINVTYDGVQIVNGDYIQSTPNIVLEFLDDSRMVINDTSNVRVFLDNKYVPYFLNGVQNPSLQIIFPDNNFLQATVTYMPILTEGNHKFRFMATDITGNFADSIVNSVVVENDLSISGMSNYPNPMGTETNFMFRITGEFPPSTCKVKIFTVAGRLIKEIDANAIVGYNSIYWDGKDTDGDYIANGTYLYKFIVQGNSQVETITQKLVILR
ncbi:MAG: C25 family cysteine peptidase [Ignavibacteria bacterium]